MWNIVYLMDLFLFLYFFVCVTAIVIHIISSRKSKNFRLHSNTIKIYRYAIIVDAIYSDSKCRNCLLDLSKQDYDNTMYDVFLLEDKKKSFIANIISIIADFTKPYDNLILLDIENGIPTNFISEMNLAYNLSGTSIQAHNIDFNNKNIESLQIAIQNEVYRQIFQHGRSSLGLPPRVEQNGILLNLKWLKENINFLESPTQTDFYLASDEQYCAFLNNLYIVCNTNNFTQKRKRYQERKKQPILGKKQNYFQAIKSNKIDLNTDLMITLLMSLFIPSIKLIWMSIISLTIITIVIDFNSCIKWLVLLLTFSFFIMANIPDKLVTKQFDRAIFKLVFNNNKKNKDIRYEH